ncbi:MAG: hypothetical protein GSR80_000837 [Desulfurococcales archaeon]|nr:hypothetical protein [Desulfurococcales archaeon]
MTLKSIILWTSALTGPVSLAVQFTDRLLNRPKLEVLIGETKARLLYTPESWAWIPRYAARTTCRPYGAVISVPVANKGRAPALECRVKGRFRLETLRERGLGRGSWSSWVELHWAGNPEESLDSAYRPLTIGGRGDVEYIDLLVYHTRNPEYYPINGIFPGELRATSRCILTLYAKPFLRGPLTRDPCKGEPPTIEYYKLPPQAPNLLHVYHIQLRIACRNTAASGELYAIILNDGSKLQIYTWDGLNALLNDIKKGLQNSEKKPIYTYTPLNKNDPPPCTL